MTDFFARMAARAVGQQVAQPAPAVRTSSPFATADQRLHLSTPVSFSLAADDAQAEEAAQLPASEAAVSASSVEPARPRQTLTPRPLLPALARVENSSSRSTEASLGPASPAQDAIVATHVHVSPLATPASSLSSQAHDRPAESAPGEMEQAARATPVASLHDVMTQLSSWLGEQGDDEARELRPLARDSLEPVPRTSMLEPTPLTATQATSHEPAAPRLTIGRLHVEVVMPPAPAAAPRPVASPMPAARPAPMRGASAFSRHVFGQRQR